MQVAALCTKNKPDLEKKIKFWDLKRLKNFKSL